MRVTSRARISVPGNAVLLFLVPSDHAVLACWMTDKFAHTYLEFRSGKIAHVPAIACMGKLSAVIEKMKSYILPTYGQYTDCNQTSRVVIPWMIIIPGHGFWGSASMICCHDMVKFWMNCLTDFALASG